MKVSKQQLSTLTVEELREVISWASGYIADRTEQRKRELWGNVRAAIAKYEGEIGPMTFYCRNCGEDCRIDEIEPDNPGIITIS